MAPFFEFPNPFYFDICNKRFHLTTEESVFLFHASKSGPVCNTRKGAAQSARCRRCQAGASNPGGASSNPSNVNPGETVHPTSV
jgi:hypothetical protein